MKNEVWKERSVVDELAEGIRQNLNHPELIEFLDDYHDNDIAEALEELSPAERKALYQTLGPDRFAEIVSYLEDAEPYLKELGLAQAAAVLSHMDSDDAVDVLEDLEEDVQEKLVGLMEEEASLDVQLIRSYEEDEIGSHMTTNFIMIPRSLTVPEAMKELVRQAGENDNIGTIYVVDEKGAFFGAIDLKDLIIAREKDSLVDLTRTSYPYVLAHQKIEEEMDRIRDYAEDSIPVLSDNGEILGVITAQDLVEVVDNAMGDDYAKLAGLTEEVEWSENLLESMKKRLPWLVILLFLGMGVSSVVGIFERVVAVLPIVICFQSLILDMAGNVGTQSLAVTIRDLVDEELSRSQKWRLISKEVQVGTLNGVLLGSVTVLFIGLYNMTMKHLPAGEAFLISACVGMSLVLAMLISSLVGTVIPLFFHHLGVDPAVASGPLITTVNDLVAVVTYYGLAWIFLVRILA